MTKTGGPATTYGILLQLLGSLNRIALLTMQGVRVSDGSIDSATLILEPISGGDVEFRLEQSRIVEQWKSRRTDRAWTVREIVKDVLPDLVCAVADDELGCDHTFRFCCQGRVSDVTSAMEFFHSLRFRDPQHFELQELDDRITKRFMPTPVGFTTQRQFFQWIALTVRSSLSRKRIRMSDVILHQKLCHLLARFHIEVIDSASQLEMQIEKWIRSRINNSDDEHVTAKRREMCGALLEHASRGNATIQPFGFLASVGLRGVPLSEQETIQQRLREEIERKARKIFRYDKSLDVRPVQEWPSDCSILVLGGPGGSGKSWRLCSMAQQCHQDGHIAVLLRSSQNTETDLEHAAEEFWGIGAGRESTPHLRHLRLRLQEFWSGDFSSQCLLLLIDDIDSFEVFSRLQGQPWADWGIRVAVTVSAELASQIAAKGFEDVTAIDIGPFSELELRTYLKRRGRDWKSIPPDVRQHLCNPLLAGIYCEVTTDNTWTPETEYDVFHRFWNHLRNHRKQIDFPEDMARLRALAGKLLGDGASYPWSIEVCTEVGIDSAVITRLCRIGWLVRDKPGYVRIWHSRLLNWAVAEYLADQLDTHDDTHVRTASALIRSHIGYTQQACGQPLGYVFMDLLWLILDDSHRGRLHAPLILSVIEDTMHPNGHPASLYESLLPTLGNRVTSALCQRLKNATLPHNYGLPQVAAKTLVAINSSQTSRTAISLLRSDNVICQEVGMLVLADHPSVDALDDLWSLWKCDDLLRQEQPPPNSRRRVRSRACEAALISCATLSPQWIAQKCNGAFHSSRDAALLASALAISESDLAPSVWETCRESLISGSSSEIRPVCNCIQRFSDQHSERQLVSWILDEEQKGAVWAFDALSRVSPDVAIETLTTIRYESAVFFWSGWADELHFRRPDPLLRCVEGIILNRKFGAAHFTPLFSKRPWRLTVSIIESLLRDTTTLLEDDESGHLANEFVLTRHLHLLSCVVAPLHLETVCGPRGKHFLRTVSRCATRWIAEGSREAPLHHVIALLLKCRGTHLTELINSLLSSAPQMRQLNAISLASCRPDARTRELLESIADSDESYELSFPKSKVLQAEATEVLVTLQSNAPLVRAMLANECDVDSIWRIRRKAAPLTDAEMSPALEILGKSTEDQRTRAVYVLGVSGRSDVIPVIQRELEQHINDDAHRRGCIWALDRLAATDEISRNWFIAALNIVRCRDVGISGLVRLGTIDDYNILLRTLESIDLLSMDSIEHSLALVLARNEGTRVRALKIALQSYRDHDVLRTMFHDPRVLELLGDTELPEARDILLREADIVNYGLNIKGRRKAAIRGLAKNDPEIAFDCAVRALVSAPHDRWEYVKLVVELAPRRGIPLLVRHLPAERDLQVRREICLSLRVSEPQQLVAQETDRLLHGRVSDRCAGVEILRWMRNDAAKQRISVLLDSESDPRVRQSALDAVAFFEAQDVGHLLFEQMIDGSDDKNWARCEMLFDLLPPELVGRIDDPLSIGDVFERLPISLQQRVNARFRQEQKSIEKEFERHRVQQLR